MKGCEGLRFQPYTPYIAPHHHHASLLSLYLELKYSVKGCVGLKTKHIESQKENALTLFLKPIQNNPSTLHTLHTSSQLSGQWSGGVSDGSLALCLLV